MIQECSHLNKFTIVKLNKKNRFFFIHPRNPHKKGPQKKESGGQFSSPNVDMCWLKSLQPLNFWNRAHVQCTFYLHHPTRGLAKLLFHNNNLEIYNNALAKPHVVWPPLIYIYIYILFILRKSNTLSYLIVIFLSLRFSHGYV